MPDKTPIHTIGHSNLEFEAFARLLAEADIELLIDVRSRPRSRRHPWFDRAYLEEAVKALDVQYQWWGEELGGYREPQLPLEESANQGLEDDEAMRAYADHLLSDEGREALNALEELATEHRLVLMCAEKDPARCHRRFLADHLVHRERPVIDLLTDERRPHKLSSRARISDGRVTYPKVSEQLGLFGGGPE